MIIKKTNLLYYYCCVILHDHNSICLTAVGVQEFYQRPAMCSILSAGVHLRSKDISQSSQRQRQVFIRQHLCREMSRFIPVILVFILWVWCMLLKLYSHFCHNVDWYIQFCYTVRAITVTVAQIWWIVCSRILCSDRVQPVWIVHTVCIFIFSTADMMQLKTSCTTKRWRG